MQSKKGNIYATITCIILILAAFVLFMLKTVEIDEKQKQEIYQYFAHKYGLKLEFKSDLKISIFPRISMSLQEVKLSRMTTQEAQDEEAQDAIVKQENDLNHQLVNSEGQLLNLNSKDGDSEQNIGDNKNNTSLKEFTNSKARELKQEEPIVVVDKITMPLGITNILKIVMGQISTIKLDVLILEKGTIFLDNYINFFTQALKNSNADDHKIFYNEQHIIIKDFQWSIQSENFKKSENENIKRAITLTQNFINSSIKEANIYHSDDYLKISGELSQFTTNNIDAFDEGESGTKDYDTKNNSIAIGKSIKDQVTATQMNLEIKNINKKEDLFVKFNLIDDNINIALSMENHSQFFNKSNIFKVFSHTQSNTEQDSKGQIQGILKIKINDLSNFLRVNRVKKFITNANTNGISQENKKAYKPLSLDLTADVVMENNSMLVSNITAQSEILEGRVDGYLNLHHIFSPSKNTELEVVLDLESLDMDRMYDYGDNGVKISSYSGMKKNNKISDDNTDANDNTNNMNIVEINENSNNDNRGMVQFLIDQLIVKNFHYFLFNKLTGYVSIKINKMKLKGDLVSDIKFSSHLLPIITIIKEFSFSTPGHSTLKLRGAISHNDIRPHFKGQVTIMSQNPTLFTKWILSSNLEKSDSDYIQYMKDKIHFIFGKFNFEMLPYNTKFTDINVALGNETLLSGYLWLTKNAEGILSTHGYIGGNKLNLDDLGFKNSLENFLSFLYVADRDYSDKTYDAVSDNYRWLRTVKGLKKLIFHFDEVILNNESLYNSYLGLTLERAKLHIDEMFLHSSILSINSANMSFTLPFFRPYINLQLKVAHADLDRLNKLVPTVKQIALNQKQTMTKLKIPETSGMNFFSARQYDGSLEFFASQIYSQDLNDLHNIATSIRLENGNITVEKFNASAFKGLMDAYAVFSISKFLPQFRGKITISNFDPVELLKSALSYKKLQGYMNLAAEFNTKGQSIQEMKSKLNGEIIFKGRDMIYNGFQASEIIKATEDQRENVPVENKVKRIDYYSQYGKTTFETLEGKIKIKDGIATINDTYLTNERLTAALNAAYDLSNQKIKSYFAMQFIPILSNVKASKNNRIGRDDYGYGGSSSSNRSESDSISAAWETEGKLNDYKTTYRLADLYKYIGYNNNLKDDSKSKAQYIPLRNRVVQIIQQQIQQ